jgi:hypothetical protein
MPAARFRPYLLAFPPSCISNLVRERNGYERNAPRSLPAGDRGSSNFPEADFGPGITFGLPVTRAQSLICLANSAFCNVPLSISVRC